jgi:hypothetical protein
LLGLEPGVPGNAGHHPGAYFVAIVKSKDEVLHLPSEERDASQFAVL